MVKMSATTAESDSEDDTVTSSECSESSDDESSEHDKDDTSDTASYRSLAFSVRKNRSTATVKSKKNKKRVRFRPGDSLVLIYIIPNREMLGLKSDSEESDYGESDDDSDDEEEDDDDDEDDDDEEDDDDSDDEADEDDCESKKNKNKVKKAKPFAKLLAVRQLNRRKSVTESKSNLKKTPEKTKPLNVDLSSNQTLKKKQRPKPNRKEKTKLTKKDSNENKTKQPRNKKSKSNAIKADSDKPVKNKRNRSRLLEIRATVESATKNHDTQTTVPKVTYKHDTRPSVIDINSSAQVHSSKPLTNRTKLQPTSFRITKPGKHSEVSTSSVNFSERSSSVAQVMSASYDSLSSVLPSSYVNLNSIQSSTVEETIKRLDPDSMNASGKRNYAWQIANGTITSQSLRTPSILPFWDSLQNSVTENNTLKLPT